MGSERFASPIMGIFCGGLNAYCMRIWPLFLRTSGSSGVLKALLLERNRQLSCNPKKKKKKKTLEAFQHLWCHNYTLASIHTVQTSTEERLELKVHLSDSSPVPLF